MKSHALRASALAILVLASCRELASLQAPTRASEPASTSATPATEGTLYARDGTAVSGAGKNSARVEPEPKRELGDAEGSRASLLELYTKAVEARNALTDQVGNLEATLADERRAATAAAEERAGLRAEITRLTTERNALEGETLDLAARLTTAQIARLEAQKALLELQIDARMREEAAASARTAAPGNAKDKKRAGGEHQ